MRKINLPDRNCLKCGGAFNRRKRNDGQLESPGEFASRKFCSHQCYSEYNSGPMHHGYKGGIRRGHDCGYLRLTDGRFVHRVVMEAHLGRPLRSDEHVHHRDENVLNNAIDNLEVTTNSEHRKHHAAKQKRDRNGKFAA